MAKVREIVMKKGNELQQFVVPKIMAKVPTSVKEYVSALVSKLKELQTAATKASMTKYGRIKAIIMEKKKALEFYIPAKDDLTYAKLKNKKDEFKAQAFKLAAAKAQAMKTTAFFEKSYAMGRRGLSMAIAGCNRHFGEAKTTAVISKLEELVPGFWKSTEIKMGDTHADLQDATTTKKTE